MELLENIKVCAKTDFGLNRKNNEDSYLIVDHTKKGYDTLSRGMIFAVADGMSGHAGGAKASHMACEVLLDYYTEKISVIEDQSLTESMLGLLEKVIRNTHGEIHRYAEENDGYERMGTTLSVLVLVSDEALLAHVGDSRIYRLRDNYLEQLTEDHTMAQLSVEMGYLEQAEATNHPLRHVLMEAIGQELDEVQTRIEKVRAGDIFLLCSDGLHHMLSDDEIKEILRGNPVNYGACDQLVQEALDKGGKDNVTVIVVRV